MFSSKKLKNKNLKVWAIVVQVDVIGKERTPAINYYGRKHAHIDSEKERTERTEPCGTPWVQG